jgi:DNA-binding transcriptional ArsR family regulator
MFAGKIIGEGMKIYNKLDEILERGSKIRILRYLYLEKDECTGRAIARSIEMSPSSTYTTLQEMRAEGLISARKKGKAILYRLREENHITQG